MEVEATLGHEFSNWQQLTDEYATAIAEMETGQPGAMLRARELGAQLLRDHPELVEPIGQRAPPEGAHQPMSDHVPEDSSDVVP